MILVDTSVWVDHLRQGDDVLAALLDQRAVLAHPFVIGEIALGHLHQRDVVLTDLQDLPQASVAAEEEVLRFILDDALFALGIGYVDAHLLASVRLTGSATLWTHDKRLLGVASRLGLAATFPHI